MGLGLFTRRPKGLTSEAGLHWPILAGWIESTDIPSVNQCSLSLPLAVGIFHTAQTKNLRVCAKRGVYNCVSPAHKSNSLPCSRESWHFLQHPIVHL